MLQLSVDSSWSCVEGLQYIITILEKTMSNTPFHMCQSYVLAMLIKSERACIVRSTGGGSSFKCVCVCVGGGGAVL